MNHKIISIIILILITLGFVYKYQQIKNNEVKIQSIKAKSVGTAPAMATTAAIRTTAHAASLSTSNAQSTQAAMNSMAY